MSILKDLESLLKPDQIQTEIDFLESYGKDWTSFIPPKPVAIVFPTSTQEVQKLVQLCRKHRQALVASGGRTGLSGGAVAAQGELVVSFDRMKKILDFNEADLSLKVQAGVVTAEVQKFAEERGFYFPVDFASAGSSQIGGNLATNAGGIHVLRYGNIRNWVSGIEVVTGAGEILQLNHGLTKNATGYDLRHLFIGSEGSLGLITEVELRLTRQPQTKSLFLFAVENWEKSIQLFSLFRKKAELSAFEIFSDACLRKVLANHNLGEAFPQAHPLYVVCEIEQDPSSAETLLDQAFEQQLIVDGVQSQSSSQSQQIWAYRENISESLSSHKPYKNDVSVKPSQIPSFVAKMEKLIAKEYPSYEVLWFGHIGDGNLHINILKPENLEISEFKKNCDLVSEILFACLKDFHGSISAEHGVGLLKKPYLHFSRSKEEIEIMRQIKKTFDPNWILNPGKIFDQ